VKSVWHIGAGVALAPPSIVQLTCRGCGANQEFNLSDGTVPPPNFLCRSCAGSSPESSPKKPNDMEAVRSKDWRGKNRTWVRVYKQLHNAGYRRPKRIKNHPPAEDVVAAWLAHIATFNWRCAECDAELTRETVCCWHPENGRFRLEACVPVCVRCAKRRAARIRWSCGQSPHHAEENRSSILEGKESLSLCHSSA
jgi:hypothetical protein